MKFEFIFTFVLAVIGACLSIHLAFSLSKEKKQREEEINKLVSEISELKEQVEKHEKDFSDLR